MSATPEPDDRRRSGERRDEPRPDDVPAPRPNDEIPANRREDPGRANREGDEARRDRRGTG